MKGIRPVTGSTNELAHPDHMYPSLLFSVWIFNQSQFRLRRKVLDLGQLNEVVYAFALVLQMEARVLESVGKLDYRLTNIMDLLL